MRYYEIILLGCGLLILLLKLYKQRINIIKIYICFMTMIFFDQNDIHCFLLTIILCAFLYLGFFVDLKEMWIPDSVSICLVVVRIIEVFFYKLTIDYFFVLIIILIVFFIKIGEVIFHKNVIGDGDLKLFIGMSLYVSINEFYLIIFLASFAGLLFCLIKRKKGKEEIPFGPFLVGSFILIAFIINDVFFDEIYFLTYLKKMASLLVDY